MSLRRLASLALLGAALTVAGCGAGSGRSGTDLAVSGTLATPDLLGGDAVSFVMTVVNRGDFEATDLEIRNATLQVAQAGLTIACTAAGGATCPAVTGASMEVARLPAGGSLVFEVRSTLNIGAILEGTVFRTGDRMRINVQLVEPRSVQQIWSHSYEIDVRDVLGAQDSVVRLIAAGVRDAVLSALPPTN